jgi:hypothetical protein
MLAIAWGLEKHGGIGQKSQDDEPNVSVWGEGG